MAQAQPAQSEAPQRTTATYGDWVVQCETKDQEPHQKVCEMEQVTQRQVQGKTIPYTLIAVGRPVKGQPLKLVVQVPVNVSFSANARIKTSDADLGIVAPFARCAPGGCFAEFDIKDDIMKKFRAASGTGKISFVDAGGHDISVPLSFNGFSQALDGLLKE
jgi:invasion protein IalB